MTEEEFEDLIGENWYLYANLMSDLSSLLDNISLEVKDDDKYATFIKELRARLLEEL